RHLRRVEVPARPDATRRRGVELPGSAPEFVRNFTRELMAGRGDELPVGAMPVDGTFPTDTARWEKRAIALAVPAWDPPVCIQCGKCAFVCPHACIRSKAYPAAALAGAPEGFLSLDWRGGPFAAGTKYTIQVAAEDCTGCGLCVEACPARDKREARRKAINMTPLSGALRARERKNYEFFLELPEVEREKIEPLSVKTSQLLRPLFEFSGACAGCGETPYIKLATQLFGDRMLVANATGCTSIYGGNLPTTPYAKDRDGRGPAWSNSLFEDNAEFGLGLRLAVDARRARAEELLRRLSADIGPLAEELLRAEQRGTAGVAEQRRRVGKLRAGFAARPEPDFKELLALCDALVRKSVWIIGGDGWAYDIGYGGLDHVVRSGSNVKLLVLDTEVYSNTGGQQSKATPRGAVARFAAAGKDRPRKDFAMLAVSYGDAYVARVAFGASDVQTLKAFQEAEAFPGPALIIAYSTCIAHGYDLARGLEQQKLAVESGYWPLFRYDPSRVRQGRNPLQLDSGAPRIPLQDYIYRETRYRMLAASRPERARRLLAEAQEEVARKWRLLEHLSKLDYAPREAGGPPAGAEQPAAV
ncbi:MAG: thiamine pyrophosphate-dependent enzyme, partial [Elusimicrobia bacterium]|nr:thiamine pyrophosphate-dependent enzyme [Elusimicrobiota bacterium]